MKKGKYFKLKISLIISFCLIVTGLVGSFYMVYTMEIKANSIIDSKNKYLTKEILRTDKEIKTIDLRNYFNSEIQVEKSDDNFNHIIVTYKNEVYTTEVNYDKNFNDKVVLTGNLISNNKQYSIFNAVEKIIDEHINYGGFIDIFTKQNNEFKNQNKIILKLKNPVSVVSSKNLNLGKIDGELIINEIDKNYYPLDDINSLNIISLSDEIKVKNYDSEVLELSQRYEQKVLYDFIKMKELTVKSNFSRERMKITSNINAENISETVYVNLENLDTNLNVEKAKNVVLYGIPNSNIEIKYNQKDENKNLFLKGEYYKNSKGKDERKFILTIDSESIYYSKDGKYDNKEKLK